eukprot:763065-Hanusia_phi.AAC.3
MDKERGDSQRMEDKVEEARATSAGGGGGQEGSDPPCSPGKHAAPKDHCDHSKRALVGGCGGDVPVADGGHGCIIDQTESRRRGLKDDSSGRNRSETGGDRRRQEEVRQEETGGDRRK